MDCVEQLLRQRAGLVEQIACLGPMRVGSVSAQMVWVRRKDGSLHERGPYLTYTFKRAGKTCGVHLRDEQHAQLYRAQIDAYHRFQKMSAQLVEVSQRLADLEAAGERGAQKKTPRADRG